MSLLEKLCKELDVNIKEIWMGNDGLHYYINSLGELYNVIYKNNLEEYKCVRPDNISRILSGELRPVWEPKHGETYYVPSVSMAYKYIHCTCGNHAIDKRNHKRNIVFKTKEEAIEAANKMLESIKEGCKCHC